MPMYKDASEATKLFAINLRYAAKKRGVTQLDIAAGLDTYQTLSLAGCRRLVPYSCRHTTQTVLALDPTVSQAERAAAMRHSIRMEDRYTHIQTHQAKKAISKMPSPDKLVQSS